MAFHNVQFPTNISRNARGGPRRKTQIVALSGGAEERNASWFASRRSYDIAYGIRKADDLSAVVSFFEARNGQLYGFRFKDWADYKSSLPSVAVAATDQALGTADGVTAAFQLQKLYASGGFEYLRDITKPVDGTVLVNWNVPDGAELVLHWNNPQSGGGADWSNYSATGANSAATYGGFTHAYEIGFTGAGRREQNAPLDIVAGTKYRARCWFQSGGVATGGNLTIRDPSTGESSINGPFASPAIHLQDLGPVTNIHSYDLGGGVYRWEFDFIPNAAYVDARAGSGNITPGETVILFGVSVHTPAETGPATGWVCDPVTGIVTFYSPPAAGGVLTAGFEFDVPVRFDSDMIDVTLDFERLGSIQSIPLLEVRE